MKLKKFSLFMTIIFTAMFLQGFPVTHAAGQISRVYVGLTISAFDPGGGTGVKSICISNSGDFKADDNNKGNGDDGKIIPFTPLPGKNYVEIQNWRVAAGDWISDTDWNTNTSRRTVYVKFIDYAGNAYVASQPIDISDSGILDFAKINNGDFYTNNPNVNINFKGADRYSNLQFSGDGGQSWITPPSLHLPGGITTNYSTSDWSFPYTLPAGDGSKYITLQAEKETTAGGIFTVTNTLSIVLDETPPTINSINVLPGSSIMTQKSVVSGNFSDASGIAKKFYAPGVRNVSYFPNGTDVQAFDSNFTVTKNGTYTICAEDNAGNRTTASAIVNNIDTAAPPVPKLTYSPSGYTGGYTTSDVTVNINADDNPEDYDYEEGKSGTKYQYSIDGGNTWTYVTGNTISFNTDVNVNLQVRAIDLAGNASSSTAPVNIYVCKNSSKVTDDDINQGSSSTGGSGIKSVKRLYGDDRIATSIAIAKELYKDKLQNVILTSEDNFPDALSGSVLANKVGAPILLVGKSAASSSQVLNYVYNSMDKNGEVYILGGNGAVSSDIESQLKAKGFVNIKRLGGDDRYQTCSLVADAINSSQGTAAVITSGENFPDALSVSSVAASKGYPIFITGRYSIPECIKQKLTLLKPQKIYVIGGSGVIDNNIMEQLKNDTGLESENIIRLGGSDRYKTSSIVADYFKLDGDTAAVASGDNFPDALTGSVYAAKKNAHILLLDNDNIAPAKDYIDKNKLENIVIFGGNGSVDQNVENKLTK